jgi:hypothetical protein
MNKIVELRASNPAAMTPPSQNSPLLNYALSGLRRCWLPEHDRWSHICHLDGRDPPNESRPPSDVFYTLNVLLGMSRVPEVPNDVDLARIFRKNALELATIPVPKYAFGMALWAAAELNLEIPEAAASAVKRLLAERKNWWSFRAQDLGMLLTGVSAQVKAGGHEWQQFAAPLFSFLRDRYHCESGLFLDAAAGFRQRFTSFATQVYLAMACYRYGELTGHAPAIGMANACTRKLIQLQGPQGEWPWFLDAGACRVLDFYEIYSVHQYGMAPALLECAERYGVDEARDALIKGFRWVLGNNQLGRSMLVPEQQLTVRSQVRKGELSSKVQRIRRALWNAYTRGHSGLINPHDVDVRLECRSYELGWILWSFGQRTDLRQLSNDKVFIDALGPR